jgi:hypothetical protein
MGRQTVDYQAKMFLYDLSNKAKEHWFKAGEEWEVSLATDADKSAIEKKYHPTLSAKVVPEILAEMFDLVNGQPIQVKSDVERALDTDNVRRNHFQYLVAFNPKRERS